MTDEVVGYGVMRNGAFDSYYASVSSAEGRARDLAKNDSGAPAVIVALRVVKRITAKRGEWAFEETP